MVQSMFLIKNYWKQIILFQKKKHGYYIMKKISSLDLDDYQDLEILKKLMK